MKISLRNRRKFYLLAVLILVVTALGMNWSEINEAISSYVRSELRIRELENRERENLLAQKRYADLAEDWRCQQLSPYYSKLNGVLWTGGARGALPAEEQENCQKVAAQHGLPLQGCDAGPIVSSTSGMTHPTQIVTLAGFDKIAGSCRYESALVFIDGSNSEFPKYLDVLGRLFANFIPEFRSNFIPLPRPKIKLVGSLLEISFEPALSGPLLIDRNGTADFSKLQINLVTGQEVLKLVYDEAIPALMKSGYLQKTNIRSPDKYYQSGRGARIRCSDGRTLTAFSSDHSTGIKFHFDIPLTIPIHKKKLDLSAIKLPAPKTQACEGDAIFDAFHKRTYCSKSSDCILKFAGCESIGINKREEKNFEKSLSKIRGIGCGSTTKCKSVVCESQRCVPRDCTESSI